MNRESSLSELRDLISINADREKHSINGNISGLNEACDKFMAKSLVYLALVSEDAEVKCFLCKLLARIMIIDKPGERRST